MINLHQLSVPEGDFGHNDVQGAGRLAGRAVASLNA